MILDDRILKWLIKNQGNTFSSPRKAVFDRNPQDFTIVDVNMENKRILIRFKNSQYPALPLYFWMFERTMRVPNVNKDMCHPLGAKLQPPYDVDSVEGQIWKEPVPSGKKSYKVSPHVCDIIALVGLIEYGYAENQSTGRRVQGIRLVKGQPHPMSPIQPTRRPGNTKERFHEEYGDTIINWTVDKNDVLIEGRKSYSWSDRDRMECLNERNNISKALIKSRIKNGGGVDLRTLDAVMKWGGFYKFPIRDPEEALSITSKAFSLLDECNISGAINSLLMINRVGISRASKIIGLYDQERYCIYDSRVGTALRSLKQDGKRIVLCPPGRSRGGDVCTNKQWAENYERLIWTLEIMRDRLNHQGYPFKIADVEMALFMMGK